MNRPFPQSSRLNSQKQYARSASEAKHAWLWRGLIYAHIPDNGSRSFKDISGNNLHAFVSSTNNLFSLKTVKEYTTIEKDSSDGSTTFSIPIGRANKYHCGDFTKIINFYLENNVKSGPTGRSIYFTISSTIGPGYYSVTIDNDFIDVNMYDSTFTSNLAYNTNSTILWKERDFNSIVITRKKELLEIYVNNIKYPLTNNSTGDYGSILIEPRLTLQLIQNAPVRNTMAVVSNRLYNRYFLPEEIAQDYAAGPCGFAARKSTKIFSFSAAPPTSQSTLIIPKKRTKLNTRQSIAQGPGDAQYPNLWKDLEFYWAPCVTPKTLTDLSKNKNNPIINEQDTWGNTSYTRFGYHSYAYTSGSQITTITKESAKELVNYDKGTLSYWFLPKESSSYSYFGWIGVNPSDMFTYGQWVAVLWIRSTSNAYIYSDINNEGITQAGSLNISTLNKIHNITVICNNNLFTTYLNGNFVAEKQFTYFVSINKNNIGLKVGNALGTDWIPVVDARYYSRILSSAEVYQNYLAGPGAPSIAKSKIAINTSTQSLPPEPSEQVRITYPYSIFNSFHLTSRIMR